MNDTAPALGTVYLIHFTQPYKRVQHYIGYTGNLAARLDAHRKGRGSRLMEVITDAGIPWELARTWEGDRNRERAIKNRKEAPRLCPLCTSKPLPVMTGHAAFTPRPAPLIRTVPVQVSPRERGLRTAGQFLGQRPGWTPDRLADALDYITRPYRDEPRHTPAQDEEFSVFTATVLDHITQLRDTQSVITAGGQP
jgi:predicted GIY-YIG superfamily endonuclease